MVTSDIQFWFINLEDYGSFVVEGTKEQAFNRAQAKAEWEGEENFSLRLAKPKEVAKSSRIDNLDEDDDWNYDPAEETPDWEDYFLD